MQFGLRLIAQNTASMNLQLISPSSIRPTRAASQIGGFLGRFEQREVGDEFKPALGHFRFAKGDFVENKLAGKQFVLCTFEFPPVAGQLPAGGLQEVASEATLMRPRGRGPARACQVATGVDHSPTKLY